MERKNKIITFKGERDEARLTIDQEVEIIKNTGSLFDSMLKHTTIIEEDCLRGYQETKIQLCETLSVNIRVDELIAKNDPDKRVADVLVMDIGGRRVGSIESPDHPITTCETIDEMESYITEYSARFCGKNDASYTLTVMEYEGSIYPRIILRREMSDDALREKIEKTIGPVYFSWKDQ